MEWLAFSDISVRNDFCDRAFLREHLFAVPPNDQGCNDDQQVRVVGLRVWKNRVHEREVEEPRQQNAAMRPIEQCSCDDTYRQTPNKERRE